MKKALIYCCAGLLGVCLTGCGTLREEQNPQPKKQAPCNEWLTMEQKQSSAKPAVPVAGDDSAKEKNKAAKDKQKKKKNKNKKN